MDQQTAEKKAEQQENGKQAEAVSSTAQEKKKKATAEVATLKDIDIYCGHPLPDYDVGPVKAYQATGKDGAANYYALVCEPHLVPRLKSVSSYKHFSMVNLPVLVLNGVVFWPPAGQQRYVFIYRMFPGKKILRPGEKVALGWRQDEILKIVIPEMIAILQEFINKEFVHGSIRPDNMFFNASSGKIENIILGDALSMPDSFSQPLLYTTVQKGMVFPAGRGIATSADDVYALGASLAVLIRSVDPMHDMTDDQILRHKIEHGSFSTLIGKERFKGSILELLRGMLVDDPEQRWTMEEILAWQDGRRLNPKQSTKHKKAARAFPFEGHKYLYPVFLAMDLGKNPHEVQRVVENEDLFQWLARSMEDDEALERIEVAIRFSQEKGTGPGYEERLAANISTALDPQAPIRFKGLRLMGDGVGRAMVKASVLKENIQPYAELFVQNVAMNWLNTQQIKGFDGGAIISRFDNCRAFMRQNKIGYGLERCVYLLCPEAHCLSEKLKDYIVTSPEEMLMAFEDLCARGFAPQTFFDRHSAAFLCVKDSKMIDAFLVDLGSGEEHKQLLAALRCMATIQKRSNMQSFPAIARTIEERLSMVYRRYHDRDVRDKLQRSIKKFSLEGDLTKMAGLLSNADVSGRDYHEFKSAMDEYAALSYEYERLIEKLEKKDSFGKGTGKEVAAIVSSLLAAVVIVFMVFAFMAGKMKF